MEVNLGHIMDELHRSSDRVTRKSCVAIRLSGVSVNLDQNGKQQGSEMTFVGHVTGNHDKAVLINAHARSSEKHTLFLANLASAIVDDWDEMHESAKLLETDKAGQEQFVREKVAWLMKYEIPHKVLMDYLGDVLECKGEWRPESK